MRAGTWAFAALAVASVLVCRVLTDLTGDWAWDLVGLLCLGCLVLPGAAIFLGATTTAGDADLGRAEARPDSRFARLVARLGVRIAALGLVAATGSVAGRLALGSRVESALAALLEDRGTDEIFFVLLGSLAGCFALATIASAFVSRPVSAALCGVLLAMSLAFMVRSLLPWLLGWMFHHTLLIGICVWSLSVLLVGLAVRVTAQRASEAPLGKRALARLAIIVIGPAVSLAVLVAGWEFIGQAAALHHAVAVRHEADAGEPKLATYWAFDTDTQMNWVAHALTEAAAPLSADLGRRARVGERPDPGVPAADGMDDLRDWLERELASPTGAVSPPPEAGLRLLARRAAEMEQVRSILLSGEGIRWGSSHIANSPCHVVHRLLPCNALAGVQTGRQDVACSDVLAVWRLSSSVLPTRDGFRTGGEMRVDVAVALRKIPIAPIEWEDRLDAAPIRNRLADILVDAAADNLRAAEDMATYKATIGMDEGRLVNGFRNPFDSWGLSTWAREKVEFARALRDPSRCALPLAMPMSWRGSSDAYSSARRLDRVVAHFELTRKILRLRRLHAADPAAAWPESVPGIEESACSDLWWKYSGGENASVVPEGPAAAWLQPGDCEPALSYISGQAAVEGPQ